MKKSSPKSDLSRFEFISESTDGKLLGGFSFSFSADPPDTGDSDGSNNCSGGNCIKGCGEGQNVNCNTVAGCGG